MKIHQLQIREHLSDVNRLQSVHRFEFQQDCILYHKVGAEPDLDRLTFVDKRNRTLPFEPQAARGKFMREAHFVGTLQEARAKGAMDLDRRTDNLIAQWVDIHSPSSFRPLRALRFNTPFGPNPDI